MTTPASRRLALVGLGRMGRAVAELAPEHGWEVVARIGSRANAGGQGAGITRESLAGAAVAIEFTTPAAAPANVRALVAAGCPVVSGTTGWYDALPEISAMVQRAGGALVAAPNFSPGVAVFERVVVLAAQLLAGIAGFDAHLVETHHAGKRDAPSGTARALVTAASGWTGRDGHGIPITSIRTGSVPGTHEVIFDAPFESIRLAHVARDRRVFAAGALAAAAWLVAEPRRGVFGMRDVIGHPEMSRSS